ncbi:hypothetical protein LB452_05775 [Psychroflexus sp. CAK8W]|uniref:Uncharacterized protein n=1 Tax=Psychroflexus longus TaxID=2873596 RepID=A0ABS7XJ44_9FLAO|nr:hypothetical protein [Psychroflexus longus]MBZ9778429.1 hypothetical protein [Psychroflexus longus]
MNTKAKRIFIAFLIGGSVFAGIMAGFDYIEGLEFKIKRFFFNFFFIGWFLSFIMNTSLKYEKGKNENTSQ